MNELQYTREKPTVEGYYFKRHTDMSAGNPNFQVTEKIVYVGKTKQGWRVQSQGPKQGYVEYGFDFALFLPEYTEWAGPIPMPTN